MTINRFLVVITEGNDQRMGEHWCCRCCQRRTKLPLEGKSTNCDCFTSARRIMLACYVKQHLSEIKLCWKFSRSAKSKTIRLFLTHGQEIWCSSTLFCRNSGIRWDIIFNLQMTSKGLRVLFSTKLLSCLISGQRAQHLKPTNVFSSCTCSVAKLLAS